MARKVKNYTHKNWGLYRIYFSDGRPVNQSTYIGISENQALGNFFHGGRRKWIKGSYAVRVSDLIKPVEAPAQEIPKQETQLSLFR